MSYVLMVMLVSFQPKYDADVMNVVGKHTNIESVRPMLSFKTKEGCLAAKKQLEAKKYHNLETVCIKRGN